MQPDVLDEFLQQPHVGVLATLRRSGMPYTVPVWWLWHDGAFWLSGTDGRVWCRQLRADPRASLCIEAMEPVPGHVGCDGTAEALGPDRFDIWPVSRLLVEKYIGHRGAEATDAFFSNMRTEPRLLFRLAPDDRPNALRAIDMRVYRGKRSDREHSERVKAEGGRQE